MEIYNFDKEIGKQITQFNSDFVMSKIADTKKGIHVGYMHLNPKGVIGYHQATTPQLFLVVSGKGKVRGQENEWKDVKSGQAIFWQEGEWHETISDTGLTAVVLEGEDVVPAEFIRRNKINEEE